MTTDLDLVQEQEMQLARLKIVIQRASNTNKKVIICFINYQKAFDHVDHDTLIKTLQRYNIENEYLQIIKNLYWKQHAYIKLNAEYSRNK